MDLKRWFLAFICFMLFASPLFSEDSDVIKIFREAVLANDRARQSEIIDENKALIPTEVSNLLRDAIREGVSKEEKEGSLYMAELMATIYKDKFGDVAPLKEVRKKTFDAKLSGPVRLDAIDGVHIIVMPQATETVKNIFMPDNVIIKKSETVRWVNNDVITHLLASMPFIGEGGLFSPKIEPTKTWDYRFEKPGEYYYICFIHKGMVGKVTVEDMTVDAPKEGPLKEGAD